MKQIILGSESPRRKEILSFFKLPYLTVPSNVDESSIPFNGDARKYVCDIACLKSQALHQKHSESIIITADTTVYRDGIVYGKANDRSEAIKTLMTLSGNWHSVFTGICVRSGNNEYVESEETRVLFADLTDNQIDTYLNNTEWKDKAGSYGIQLGGALLIEQIEGCFYNVLGLPVTSLKKLLPQVGIDLWDYL